MVFGYKPRSVGLLYRRYSFDTQFVLYFVSEYMLVPLPNYVSYVSHDIPVVSSFSS